ncbi:MAG: YraN family protein [Verrucomicrobia bacterium]|nr:YraN family protein [Verrucomicrobiota bacterium]
MGVISRTLRKLNAVLGLPTGSGKTARNDPREQMGFEGELEAARHLKRSRLKILVHRYRCRLGEIDLVAREGDTLVFVEVKTRQNADFGEPAEAVTLEKQRHISRVALDYLRRLHNPEIPVRFDVVEIVSSGNALRCRHIRDAFSLAEPYIY